MGHLNRVSLKFKGREGGDGKDSKGEKEKEVKGRKLDRAG